jgi:hypothetical protein
MSKAVRIFGRFEQRYIVASQLALLEVLAVAFVFHSCRLHPHQGELFPTIILTSTFTPLFQTFRNFTQGEKSIMTPNQPCLARLPHTDGLSRAPYGTSYRTSTSNSGAVFNPPPRDRSSSLEPGEIDERDQDSNNNLLDRIKDLEQQIKILTESQDALKELVTYWLKQNGPTLGDGVTNGILQKLATKETTLGAKIKPTATKEQSKSKRDTPNTKIELKALPATTTNHVADSKIPALDRMRLNHEKLAKEVFSIQKEQKKTEDEVQHSRSKVNLLLEDVENLRCIELHNHIQSAMQTKRLSEEVSSLWQQVQRVEVITISPEQGTVVKAREAVNVSLDTTTRSPIRSDRDEILEIRLVYSKS